MLKRSTLLSLLITCCLTFPQTSRAAGDIEVAGDIVQVLIPSIAYGSTFYLDDEEGRDQFYYSFFTNLGITYAVKIGVNKTRPNGGNHSFPSGHTSASFQGAAFIHARYGYKYAIPAYVAAAFVGYSRVQSNNHFVSDVIAGAALGTACSFYFTDPREDIVVQPIVSRNTFGINVSSTF